MKKMIWAGAVGLLPLFSSAVQASVNVQTFTPAPGTSYVYTEDALMQVAPGDSTWTGDRLYFHLIYNYDNQPLVEFDPTHTYRDNTIIDGINTFDLGVGYLPMKDLMLALDLPVNWVNLPSSSAQFGWGDMRLEAKYRVTPDDAPVAVALIPNLTLPTGDTTLFLSNNSVGIGFALAVERDFGPFRASANIGYRHYSSAVYQDINYENMVPMSLGVYIPINNQWGINVEGFGSLSLPVNHYNNPGEFYAGGHYQISRDASVLLGAATGSVGGGGSGDFRVIAGVKFSPMDMLVTKKAPPKPVYVPRPVVRPAPVVKPVPKPKLLPKPKKKLVKKKPAKKHVKKKPVKKHKPKAAPTTNAGGSENAVDITTTTTTTTETRVTPRHKATPKPQPPTSSTIGKPQP